MTITYYYELALFAQEVLEYPGSDHAVGAKQDHACNEGVEPYIDAKSGKFKVTYHPPPGEMNPIKEAANNSIEVPLEPDIDSLVSTGSMQPVDILLHRSPTKAYIMPTIYNDWFSEKLGWSTKLAYVGSHRREVLGNVAPNAEPLQDRREESNQTGGSLTSWLGAFVPKLSNGTSRPSENSAVKPDNLTFADIAPYLVVTRESLADVSARLPHGMEMDVTKFRPNIVLTGAEKAYDEDFWGGITIETMDSSSVQNQQQSRIESLGHSQAAELILTQNCGRCRSLNVDYDTGKACPGEDGSVLKKMMKDRRVDEGAKWSPIFGRYGFLKTEDPPTYDAGTEEKVGGRWIGIGSKAEVSVRNQERTSFCKRCQHLYLHLQSLLPILGKSITILKALTSSRLARSLSLLC